MITLGQKIGQFVLVFVVGTFFAFEIEKRGPEWLYELNQRVNGATSDTLASPLPFSANGQEAVPNTVTPSYTFPSQGATPPLVLNFTFNAPLFTIQPPGRSGQLFIENEVGLKI